jgi:hypothetical protein
MTMIFSRNEEFLVGLWSYCATIPIRGNPHWAQGLLCLWTHLLKKSLQPMVAEVENAGFFNFITYFTVCKDCLLFWCQWMFWGFMHSFGAYIEPIWRKKPTKHLEEECNGEFQAVGCSKTRQR